MIYLTLFVLYLIIGLYWVNKLGNENRIENILQTLIIIGLWPVSAFLYYK